MVQIEAAVSVGPNNDSPGLRPSGRKHGGAADRHRPAHDREPESERRGAGQQKRSRHDIVMVMVMVMGSAHDPPMTRRSPTT